MGLTWGQGTQGAPKENAYWIRVGRDIRQA